MQREWFEKDYYATLGVSQTASPKEITSAYRKLAREFHPDANPGDAAAEDRFKEVSAAYEVVGDAERRGEYDEARRLGPMAGGFGPGASRWRRRVPRRVRRPRRRAVRRWRHLGPDRQPVQPGSRRPPERGAHRPAAGPDIESDLHLSFDDSISGATTTVNITSDVRCPDCVGSGAATGTAPHVCPECGGKGAVDEDQGFFSFSRPCGTCGGRGRVIDTPCATCGGVGAVRRPRQVKVRIPQGVRDGQRIRVKGKGGAGANGGPDGDLYVKVHVGTHPLFGRSGDNLTLCRSPSPTPRRPSAPMSRCRRSTAIASRSGSRPVPAAAGPSGCAAGAWSAPCNGRPAGDRRGRDPPEHVRRRADRAAALRGRARRNLHVRTSRSETMIRTTFRSRGGGGPRCPSTTRRSM